MNVWLIIFFSSFGVSKGLDLLGSLQEYRFLKKISKDFNLEIDEVKNILEEIGFYSDSVSLCSEFLPIYNIVSQGARLKNSVMDVYMYEEALKVFKPELIGDRVKKEYFIGYFDEENRPITIFFSYDGESIEILKGTAPTFLKISYEEQTNILMYLLYCCYCDINSVNHCYNIREIFDENLLLNLIESFEGTCITYRIEDENKKRIRKNM